MKTKIQEIFDINFQYEVYYSLLALFAMASGSPIMSITILIWLIFSY